MQRIYLITPPEIDLGEFPGELKLALEAGDIAAVLIASGESPDDRLAAARALVPLIQDHGSAAIILNSRSIAEETGADGVHIDDGEDALQNALEQFKPGRIVGAGGISNRHLALEFGERDVDYLFFGEPVRTEPPQPSKLALDLATWWSEFTQVPAIVMTGGTFSDIDSILETGADFIAAGPIIWNHDGGPSEAVSLLSKALAAREPS